MKNIVTAFSCVAFLFSSPLSSAEFLITTSSGDRGHGYGVVHQGRCVIFAPHHIVLDDNYAVREIEENQVNLLGLYDTVKSVPYSYAETINVRSLKNDLTEVIVRQRFPSEDMVILEIKSKEKTLNCSSKGTVSKVRDVGSIIGQTSPSIQITNYDETRSKKYILAIISGVGGTDTEFTVDTMSDELIMSDSGSSVYFKDKLLAIVTKKDPNRKNRYKAVSARTYLERLKYRSADNKISKSSAYTGIALIALAVVGLSVSLKKKELESSSASFFNTSDPDTTTTLTVTPP